MWRVPQGVETSHQILKIHAVDEGIDGVFGNSSGLKSVLNFAVVLFHNDTPYPAPKRNVPSSNWK